MSKRSETRKYVCRYNLQAAPNTFIAALYTCYVHGPPPGTNRPDVWSNQTQTRRPMMAYLCLCIL